jgi:hypothetical protein
MAGPYDSITGLAMTIALVLLSDERDAKAILHARFDDELELLVQSDEAAGRKPPDCKRRVTIGG